MKDYLRSSPVLLAGMVLLLLLLGAPASTRVAAQAFNDDYLRGYAAAVLKMNFGGSAKIHRVERGVVYVENMALSEEDQTALRRMLSDSEGFVRLELVKPSDVAAESRLDAYKRPPEDDRLPMFLAKSSLFQPLIADPRWPHFSAAYQRYLGDRELANVGAASFGETFSLYRFAGPRESVLEAGIQAGVFSIFDLGAESHDLVNADYMVGIPIVLKKGNFSNQTSLYHQSSHLGDEFLLRNRVQERVNLSYEGLSSIFSYHLPLGFRGYGGGGYLIHKDPSNLDPWSAHFGMEFRSPEALLGGALRPVAALDIQCLQENDWGLDLSFRTGFQFQNPDFFSRKMMLLLEYYKGQSPNGQFFERDIESLGIGLHFFID